MVFGMSELLSPPLLLLVQCFQAPLLLLILGRLSRVP
jgi:hypothetical protein